MRSGMHCRSRGEPCTRRSQAKCSECLMPHLLETWRSNVARHTRLQARSCITRPSKSLRSDSLSGEVLRFERETPLKISEPENGKFMLWPGYFYYYPAKRELRFCWGQGSVHDLSTIERLTPIAALDGDWSEIKKRAQSQLTE